MTDLVSQLVGALDAFVERFKDHEDTGPRGEMWQSDEFLAELAQARAALSEAKAGGWVAVPVEPVAYRVDWPVEAGVGMRRFYGADEWESARGTVEFLGGIPVPLAPLPNPPKEQA